ncbi:hypothetical protein DV735_g1053, partial [Chaetothyriales sp. CBS 134920]
LRNVWNFDLRPLNLIPSSYVVLNLVVPLPWLASWLPRPALSTHYVIWEGNPIPWHVPTLIALVILANIYLSNGIRFSITNLSPGTARSLPTVYQDREGISLYDAQYSAGEKGPIPQDVIEAVLAALKRFQIVCADFGVPETNIRVLATEATRNAINSDDFRGQIRDATGWEVNILPKEAEGRIGALGVASSFDKVQGLVMDLGGGSTQITWLVAEEGRVETSSKGSFSFPYGAAALSRELALISEQGDAQAAKLGLAAKMKTQFQQAYLDLELPASLEHRAHHGGLTLYLSGGGFRGWGYLLMARHKVHPYPIPIINGFTVNKHQFEKTVEVESLAAEAEETPLFRISKRRAAQVPAIAFLVNVIISALPMIQEIRFCQGGVREGFLYDLLDPSIKALDPLPAASARFASPSADAISQLLQSALPAKDHDLDRWAPPALTPAVLRAVADLMYFHSDHPKESRANSALLAPITGALASAHGVSHTDRALLALVLSRRWGGQLAPPYGDLESRLQATLSKPEVWWCHYLGAVANLIGHVYPSGAIDPSPTRKRLEFQSKWTDGLGKKGLDQGVLLRIRFRDGDIMTSPTIINSAIDEIDHVGKKKSRIGGKEFGYGVAVKTKIDRVDQF